MRTAALQNDVFDQSIDSIGPHGELTDEVLASYIAALSSNATLREAIAVSSGALSAELDKIVAGVSTSRKKLLRTAVSVTRYARRITGRPTPFGLLAGVSAVAKPGNGELAPQAAAPVKSVRPDAAWFDGLVAQWLGNPGLRRSLHVVMNNLCFVRGDRLVLPHVRVRDNSTPDITTQQATQELSMRYTALLQWVRSAAMRPVLYTDLLAAATKASPGIAESRLDSFLGSLIAHEVLLTQLSLTSLDSAGLEELEQTLPARSRERAQLGSVRSALAVYTRTAPGEGRNRWDRLAGTLAEVHPAGSTGPQVDLGMDLGASVPESVRREAERYATAMWSISARTDAFSHMRGYRRAFLDTYGQHGAVRLEELVDPHRGLGYPATYLHPRTSTDFPSGKRRRVPVTEDTRERALADVLHRGLVSGQREVVLTEEDIARLSTDAQSLPPSSLEVCFQLLAKSRNALEAGEFTLLSTPTAGTLTAGAMAGRFAELTGTSASLGRLLDEADGALAAQVAFIPVLPRALNVMQVPDLLPHSIPIGTFGDPSGEGRINWRDLIVAADGDRLRLYWEKTDQEVRPVVPHVLSLSTAAPNLARFLGELPYCGEDKTWQPWNWGPFEHLPWLPRVRLGRVVISPLTWRPSEEMLTRARSNKGWQQAVDTWRHDLRVDSRVNVGRRDQICEIDLSGTLQREMLRREVAQGRVAVTESPRRVPGAYGWLDGHSNEIVVPLRSAPKAAPGLDRQRVANTAARTAHRPGSTWAFVELHAVPEVHEELITSHVPALLDRTAGLVDRWFFMRYRQSGDHVRLRLKGTHKEAMTTVWPEILRTCDALKESGLLQEVRISSYEPEVSRYGGREGVRRAEDWFHADSRLTTELLTALGKRGTTALKSEVLLAGYIHLLDSLGSWDWHTWIDCLVPKGLGRELSQNEVCSAARLLRPGQAAALLAGVLAAPAQPWLDRITVTAGGFGELVLPGIGREEGRGWQDTAVSSLLHMHHNRLHGIDPVGETAGLVLLAHAVRAHQGQVRHTSGSRPGPTGR
ncbi:lantibiotic dehydratase [Kitasatospora sp. NPDC096077]|uniref:lantibiotic dehydratase n=1 Tax=Kitasatospora sp. NPDC096077 TaxID=3155544 RepID=UPI00332DC39F